MSLATRCTSCGTIFRVVQDQLKVSEGWVRCGRCQEVFSALDGLFDLEREAPPQRVDAKPSAGDGAADRSDTADAADTADTADTAGPRATADRPVADLDGSQRGDAIDFDPFVATDDAPALPASAQTLPSTHETDAIESRFLPQVRADADDSKAFDAADADGFYSARFQPDAADDVAAPMPPRAAPPRPSSAAAWLSRWRARRDSREMARASSMLEPAVGAVAASTAVSGAARSAAPSAARAGIAPFGGEAPQRRRQRPRVVAAWAIGAGVLLLALLGQVGHQFRDVFATQWPQSRGTLRTLCEWTGCRIEPLRRLAAVTVEDSGLTQVQGADAYRLSVTLHNRSAFEVAVPSIDLSLTDGTGALVARRALAPRDFAAGAGTTAANAATASSAPTLAPGSETQLQALLASRARITGYTVELFYP